jgi:hypothetical protein
MLISDTACNGKSEHSGQESAMKLKLNSETKITTLLTAVAVASICIDTAQVYTTQKQKHDDRGSVYYYLLAPMYRTDQDRIPAST